MPKTTETQKSTAMDYLSAPRNSGIVKNLMSLLGFTASEGGRLPVGVKYDTLVALNDVLSVEEFNKTTSAITSRIIDLQASRRLGAGKVSATPESIISAVKTGRISLTELKAKLEAME